MDKKNYTPEELSELLFPKNCVHEHPDMQRLLAEVAAPSGELSSDRHSDAVEVLLDVLGKRYAKFADLIILEELAALDPDRPAWVTIEFQLCQRTGGHRRAIWEWLTYNKSADLAKTFQDETNSPYELVKKIGDTIDLYSESGPDLAGFAFTMSCTADYVQRVAAQIRAEARSKLQDNSTRTFQPEPTEQVVITTAEQAIKEIGSPYGTASQIASCIIENGEPISNSKFTNRLKRGAGKSIHFIRQEIKDYKPKKPQYLYDIAKAWPHVTRFSTTTGDDAPFAESGAPE